MLPLTFLKPLRFAANLKRPVVSHLTGIESERLRLIDIGQVEPWFDEAVLLARCLCTDGILPLLGADTLDQLDAGIHAPHDLPLWRTGIRTPLSLACRVAITFGLDDPYELHVSPRQRQLWAILECSERNPEAVGWCPWCTADILSGSPHLPTCLPNNLWEPHDNPLHLVSVPIEARHRQRSMPAKGLRALRLGRDMTQADVGVLLGLHANYYSRLERGDLPFKMEYAQKLAVTFGVDVAKIYAAPPEHLPYPDQAPQ